MLTWVGKRDAIRLLQMPTRATLVPCPEESIDWDITNSVFVDGDNL
jgi:adenine-specific DNA-methyltransferase